MSETNQPEGCNPPVIDYSRGLPAGAPRRWKFTPVWPVVLAGTAAVFVAGGGMLTIVAVTCTPTMGASRSTRLQWEQRSAEIAGAGESQISEAPHD